MRAASQQYLEGSPLMWMMLLQLIVNLNADDDDDVTAVHLSAHSIAKHHLNNMWLFNMPALL